MESAGKDREVKMHNVNTNLVCTSRPSINELQFLSAAIKLQNGYKVLDSVPIPTASRHCRLKSASTIYAFVMQDYCLKGQRDVTRASEVVQHECRREVNLKAATFIEVV